MEAIKLIDDLQTKGIHLFRHGDKLKWRVSMKRGLTKAEKALLKQRKQELLKHLEGPKTIPVPGGTRASRLFQADCLSILERMPDNAVDLIVTDPPYGYKFMGKDWDRAVPSVAIWRECLRVLKPGAFAYIMSSPRQDVLMKMIGNLTEAGFKTDFTSLYWAYASGFPKAHNIGKAIDKKAGAKRPISGRNPNSRENCNKSSTIYESGTVGKTAYLTTPATPEAKVFDGAYGGFQPKPAVEVILVVQKPLSETTCADQALANGKGCTWLDDCRIPYTDETDAKQVSSNFTGDKYKVGINWSHTKILGNNFRKDGRFPSNLLVSDNALDNGKPRGKSYSRYFSLDAWAERNLPFLIAPKASTTEKNDGCEHLTSKQVDQTRIDSTATGCNNPRNRGGKERKNHHPTVKPMKLMAYLITMGSREGDVVLDPFCGSGTTCLTAHHLKRRSIGIEIDAGYFEIFNARIRNQVLLSHREGTITNNPKTKPGAVAKSKRSEIDAMGRGTCIIKDDSGVEHKATTSLIISASRKTDIPAHFTKNFMDRLRRGYLKVTFPKTRYISFEDTRLIVFWTKNPQPLLGYLDEIDDMGLNYYFQFTLNDYEDERLEPNLPSLGERIDTFKALSAKIGKERVIWRFDPLILTDKISSAKIVRKAGRLMKRLHPYTEKLVISFLKASKHKKVERSLTKAGIRYMDFSAGEIAYIADALGRMGKQHGVQVMACSESMNLAPYGIGRNKCIDDALVRKLFSHDKDLLAFANSGKILKDTGQRPLCGCIPSLDIGTYDTCRHFCTYCYANHSEDAVENKINRISGEDDLLVPDAMD